MNRIALAIAWALLAFAFVFMFWWTVEDTFKRQDLDKNVHYYHLPARPQRVINNPVIVCFDTWEHRYNWNTCK